MDASGLMTSAYITRVEQIDTATTSKPPDSSSLVKNFSEVKSKLNELLQSFDRKIIADQCGLLLASEPANITLFTADFVDVLKESCSTSTLLHRIAPFMNWCDHSIINTIVEVNNIPEATKLLTEFDGRIDPSQPLMKYPIPVPTHHMVPYDTSTYTVLAVQLRMQLCRSTLQHVFDTRLMLLQQCQITAHCLQLLAVANTSHTIIYWTVPKHVAGLITSKVLQNQNYLYQNGIQQVAIYPGTALVTDSALAVGLFSFFTVVSFNDCLTIIIILTTVHYSYLLVQVRISLPSFPICR